MSTMFSVSFNLEAALQQMGVVLDSRIRVATARAINRTADSEKVALGRAVASDMGLKVGVVKDAITVERANANTQTARVIAKGARIPLVDFGARGPEPSRGKGRGVTARLPGGKGRYPNAFLATMASGHRGVFQRTKRARLPIYELYGPSIARVFERMIPIGEARRLEVLTKNVSHEIQFALSSGA